MNEAELFAAGLGTRALRMSEDELLAGLTDALRIAGWRWTHIRRSDGVTMGDSGLPDIIATHPTRPGARVLAWELKDHRGQLTPEQWGWQLGLRDRIVDARTIRPAEYDDALALIIEGRELPNG
jgi:hypothetical protein